MRRFLQLLGIDTIVDLRGELHGLIEAPPRRFRRDSPAIHAMQRESAEFFQLLRDLAEDADEAQHGGR